MQDNERYQVLATKVSNEAWTRINRLARKKGLTIYELVQMVCDTLIRYMDDRHNLTGEMEKAMAIFEHLEGWAQALNLADPTVDKTIGEATYYLYDPDGKKKGTRAVHVMRPFFGNWTEDTNIQHILEKTINNIIPERYRRLRLLATDLDCKSLLELIDTLIDLHAKDCDLKALREEFEDADRSEWGVKPKTDGPYKRHHSKQLDIFAEEERKKEAQERKRLEKEFGFRPHGHEW